MMLVYVLIILFIVLIFSCLIIFVYTWDIPAPKKTMIKNININNKVLK